MKKFIEEYLPTEPCPVAPLQASSLGMLAKIKMFSGKNCAYHDLMENAEVHGPCFSIASVIPGASLFNHPINSIIISGRFELVLNIQEKQH